MTYNIFIGHAWAHNRDTLLLKAMLKEYPQFKWKDVSSPPYDPMLDTGSAEGKARLTELLNSCIAKADCVLITPRDNSAYLEWIRVEVALARKLNKPVIVVLPPGVTSVPDFMREAATETVGWSAASIVAAIRN